MRTVSRRLMAAFVALSAIALIGVGCDNVEEGPRIPGGSDTTAPSNAMCFEILTTTSQADSIMVLPISAFMSDQPATSNVFVDLSKYTVTAWVPIDGIATSEGNKAINATTTIGIIDIQPIDSTSTGPWGGDLPSGGITDQPVKVGM